MTQNQRDAAPRGANGKRLVEGAVTEPTSAPRVADYLRAHPDFLHQYPDLLEILEPPAPAPDNGVVDLQRYLVERLRLDLAEVTTARDELIATGRGNLAAQARVHKASLVLLGATSFEQFMEILTTDLALILDLDVVTIGVEQSGDNFSRARSPGVFQLEPNTIDRLIGAGRNLALQARVIGDPAIFGAGAGLVSSMALIRLSVSGTAPGALLALGARQPDQFQPGQGTELLVFLGRVVESCIRGWLNLPD